MAILSILHFMGCKKASLLPVHDEILVYPLPLDVTYLRTVDAVQRHPDWDLDWTDKEKGLIGIYNQRFSSFADADERSAILVVKRVNDREASVRFDPKSISIVGGDEILGLIKQHLSSEVDKRKAFP